MVIKREQGLLRSRFALILSGALLLAFAAFYMAGIAFDWYGELENSGQIKAGPIPAEIRARQDAVQIDAAKEMGVSIPVGCMKRCPTGPVPCIHLCTVLDKKSYNLIVLLPGGYVQQCLVSVRVSAINIQPCPDHCTKRL